MLLFLLVLLSPETCRAIFTNVISWKWSSDFIEDHIRLFHYTCLAFLWAFLLTLITYYSGRHKKKVKTGIYIVAIIHFTVLLFLRRNFAINNLSPQVLQLIAETTPGEASGFFSTFLFSRASIIAFVQVAVMIVIIFMAERYYPRVIKKIRLSHAVKIAGSCLVATFIVLGLYSTRIYFKMYACTSIEQLENCGDVGYGTYNTDGGTTILYSFHSFYLASKTTVSSREKTVYEAKHGDATLVSNDSTLNVVLIIGESFIKHHASIYGYPLETTPLLRQEQRQGNLAAFNDVVSPYNITSSTLKNMLSCKTRDMRWWDAPMLMALLKHAGYKVFAWDNQKQGLSVNSFAFSLDSFLYGKEVNEACYTLTNQENFEFDGELVSDFDKKVINAGLLGNFNFMVFHLWGQHFDFEDRFPERFEHFTADSINRNEKFITPKAKRAIAAFDNATLYNDWVVASIINKVRATNSVVIYVSDHGEEVYDYRAHQGRANIANDKSQAVNANLVKFQNQVPFVIWMSDSFMKSHPDVATRVNQATDVPFMNTDLSHIILYLAQVKTKFYSPSNNPLSPSFKPGKRIIYDNIDYDDFMKNNAPRH